MSLLMEALKKAEEAKRRAGEGGESPELTLEPLTAQNAATSPLPDLAQHFATVDADLASIPTDAPPAAVQAHPRPRRATHRPPAKAPSVPRCATLSPPRKRRLPGHALDCCSAPALWRCSPSAGISGGNSRA